MAKLDDNIQTNNGVKIMTGLVEKSVIIVIPIIVKIDGTGD